MGHHVERGRPDIIPMDGRAWDWFNSVVPLLWVQDTRGIVAVRKGKFVAGCVYDNWTNGSVTCHHIIVEPTVIRHGWLEAIHTAAFGEARKVILGLVAGNNAAALKFNKHMGFTEICRIKDGWDIGVDNVVMEMRREDCPYLEENNG
ncbi:hypothetical protein N9937_01335 [bacterium]|nr:hypothetical protein [bacterium]